MFPKGGSQSLFIALPRDLNFFKLKINSFEDIRLVIILNLRVLFNPLERKVKTFAWYEKNLEAGFSLIDEVFELRSKGIYSNENEIKTKEAEKKCEEAIKIMPNKKEGYLCKGIVVGLQKIYTFGGGLTLSKQKKVLEILLKL